MKTDEEVKEILKQAEKEIQEVCSKFGVDFDVRLRRLLCHR